MRVNNVAKGCEILLGQDRARDMQDLIEGATGAPCPCKQGFVCPLLNGGMVGPRVAEPAA